MAAIALRGVQVGQTRARAASRPAASAPSASALLAIDELGWDRGMLGLVLGGAGAGKSLLLEVLTGAVTPDRGSVLLEGRDVRGLDAAARGVGWHDRHPVVYEHLSVRRNLALPIRGQVVDPARAVGSAGRIDALLQTLGLAGKAETRADRLDDSERFRVSLGRLLIRQDLHAIVLDEPFAGLPASREAELAALIADIQRSTGQTLLIATRESPVLLAQADHLVLLEAGRVVAQGALPAVIDDAQLDAVARLAEGAGGNRLAVSFDEDRLCLGGRALTEPLPDRLQPWLAAHQTSYPDARITLALAPEHVRLVAAGAPGSVAADLVAIEDRGHWLLARVCIGTDFLQAQLPVEPAALALLARLRAVNEPVPVGVALFNEHCRFYRDGVRL